jgi:CubicO group peptidase (beta-lactamase class C family)
MKSILIILVLLPRLLFAQQTAVVKSDNLEKRVDDYLSSYAHMNDLSGVVLIAQDNQVLFEKAYGFANAANKTANTTETAFRIASLSKTFTAAAISILIERGKVKLQDPLKSYIPDFPNGENILVRQLLLHSSGVGFVDSADFAGKCQSTAELVKLIAAVPPLFPPGKSDSYSNEGYVLLAAIIEKASGQDYETFLKKNIFEPLNMNHTGVMCTEWPVSKHSSGSIAGLGNSTAPLPFEEAGWNGAGSLYSTAGDLLIWLQAINSNKLFKFSELEYPYGWGKRNYSGKPSVEQTGQLEGYTAHMTIYPHEKIFFVFLNNIESGMTNRLPKDFEALMFGGTPSSAPNVQEVSEVPSHDLEGAFINSDIPVPLNFVLKQNRLWMHWGNNPFLRPLIMTSKDVFFLRAEYATITFQRDDKGTITGMSYKFGDEKPLNFVRK